MPVVKSRSKEIKDSVFEIANKFVQYYKSAGYDIIPGSSLLDPAVPMAFVMSAGLAQVESSTKAIGDRIGEKYTLIQNCFRYFDLKNIGKTPYHLSLFRMPGAFTFGSCSKHTDIIHTFRLLTEIYKFPREKLWATFFSGDIIEGIQLPPDIETYYSWKKIGISKKQIIGLDAKNNFWKQNANFIGENHAAKCGPNTEVFFDRGEEFICSSSCKPPCDCGRFVEITNTLFITLSIDENIRKVFPLEEPFIETVVGAERVAMLSQGVPTIFEIDCLEPIVNLILKYIQDDFKLFGIEENAKEHVHIIADHIRAILFLIADGAPAPGKGGRARLMRKLIREMLVSMKILELNEDFIIPSIVDNLISFHKKEFSRDLNSLPCTVWDYICQEKERFNTTIEKGLNILDHWLKYRAEKKISGNEILLMEKRYGIPASLLKKELYNQKVNFDIEGYDSIYRNWEMNLTI